MSLPEGELFTTMAAAVDDTLTAIDHLTEHADEMGIGVDQTSFDRLHAFVGEQLEVP